MKNLSKRITTIVSALVLVIVLGVALTACGGAKELTHYDYMDRLGTGYSHSPSVYGDEFFERYFAEAKNKIGLTCAPEDVEWLMESEKEVAVEGQTEPKTIRIFIIKMKSEDLAKNVLAAKPTAGGTMHFDGGTREGKVVLIGDSAALHDVLGK